MLEVPIRIKEKQFKAKDGILKTSKEIKFWDLGFEQYIVVEKIYDDVKTFEGTKDGKEWKINKTTVKYKGEDVYVNISDGSLDMWNSLPKGKVMVSKQEFEGAMGTFTKYKFEPYKMTPKEVADATGGIVTDEVLPF